MAQYDVDAKSSLSAVGRIATRHVSWALLIADFWGRRRVKRPALTGFGKGFSYANLSNFRLIYLTYLDWEICYTACSKLSWSHSRLIMREDDDL